MAQYTIRSYCSSIFGGILFNPQTYDRYLTENYGDWYTPKINFDSALDTPNMEVIDNKAMLIYLYKKLSHKNTLNPNLRLRLEQALNHYETISH